MRACVLHAIGDLRCEEWPKPESEAGQALVRVGAVGVCGSDIPRIFTKGAYSFPLIPGHEMAGIVEEISGEADRVRVGNRVVVFPLIPCGVCEWCRAGKAQLCDDYDYLGSRRDGGFAEYVSAPVENLLPIPEAVSIDWAAMTEPTAVARHAVRRGGIETGDTVWVIGAGPIGLILAQWATRLGADAVLLTDIDAAKLEVASAWPGVQTFNSATADPVEWVLSRTRDRGADLVIEAVGLPVTIRQALCGARKHGRVVLMGNPAGDVSLPQSDYWQILRRELTVVGTWNSSYGTEGPDDWRDSLQAMADGLLDLAPLITHRVSLADAPEMMRCMKDGEEAYIKVLVIP